MGHRASRRDARSVLVQAERHSQTRWAGAFVGTPPEFGRAARPTRTRPHNPKNRAVEFERLVAAPKKREPGIAFRRTMIRCGLRFHRVRRRYPLIRGTFAPCPFLLPVRFDTVVTCCLMRGGGAGGTWRRGGGGGGSVRGRQFWGEADDGEGSGRRLSSPRRRKGRGRGADAAAARLGQRGR